MTSNSFILFLNCC